MGPPLKGDEFLAGPRHPPHDPNSRKGRNNKGATTKTKERKRKKKKRITHFKGKGEREPYKIPKRDEETEEKSTYTSKTLSSRKNGKRRNGHAYALSSFKRKHPKRSTSNRITSLHSVVKKKKKNATHFYMYTYLPKQIKSKQTVEIQRIILCCVRNPGKSPAFTTLGLCLLLRVLKNSCLLMLGSFFFFFKFFFFF